MLVAYCLPVVALLLFVACVPRCSFLMACRLLFGIRCGLFLFVWSLLLVVLGLLIEICWWLVVVLLFGDCCVCDVLFLFVLSVRCVLLFVHCYGCLLSM